ncbi:MAG: hypothetical protein KAY32_02180 [Candidatus Eisenbacteria sp.]|nr:hypothetical protein [Candidatus Eisenbacteria bacterium]
MRGLCLLGGSLLLVLIPVVCQAGIGGELDNFGSFGISVGAMRWLADADAREFEGSTAQIRPMVKGVFRYRFNEAWLGTIEAGYGWNGYADSGDLTTVVIPVTVGMERRLRELWGATTSLAFGGGVYVWGQRRDGEFLRDPATSKRLQATDPGAYLGGVSEFHVSDHVTCTTHLTVHYIYSTHADDYPTLLGDDDIFTDLRIGLNYYFSPYEGLVWDTGDED